MMATIAAFLSQRRFRPTLWPTLGLLALLAATLNLGNWQRHRAEEKALLRTQYDLAIGAPPVQLSAASADADALRFQPVRATGEFAAAAQVLIDNKVHAGRPGYDVVTPLRLVGDRYVLVDRGWVPSGARRSDLPQVPPPSGIVTIDGRANLPPARYLELQRDTSTGPVRQNLDIARIGEASGLPLLPFIIEQTGGSADGLVRAWPAPDFGIEQHQSYMLQWYAFALLGCVLWLTLNWRKRESDNE
ncbi:MAG: SURF1 family protein [Casimicrobiaceae bacterium]